MIYSEALVRDVSMMKDGHKTHKGTIYIDFKHVVEILRQSRVMRKAESQSVGMCLLTLQESIILRDHFRLRAIAAQWTPPNRDPLGITLSACSQAACTACSSEISV